MILSMLVVVHLWLQKFYNFLDKNLLDKKSSLYLHSHLGRLAQLVQSISFTPRGSGVRIPHRPQKKG